MEPATPATAAPLSSPRRVIFMYFIMYLPAEELASKKKRGDPVAAPVVVEMSALLHGPPYPPAEPRDSHDSHPEQQKETRRLGDELGDVPIGQAAQNARSGDVVAFGCSEGKECGVDIDVRRETRDQDGKGRGSKEVRTVRTVGDRGVARVVDPVIRRVADDGVRRRIAAIAEITQPIVPLAAVDLEIPEGRDSAERNIEGAVAVDGPFNPLARGDRPSVDEERLARRVVRQREPEIA